MVTRAHRWAMESSMMVRAPISQSYPMACEFILILWFLGGARGGMSLGGKVNQHCSGRGGGKEGRGKEEYI